MPGDVVHNSLMSGTAQQGKPSRIRVLFDATYLDRQDGTGRYTREVLRALRCQPDLDVLTRRAPRLERLPRVLRVPVNGALHAGFIQLGLPLLANIHKAHVVHTMAVAPWFCPAPVVVTIHDALDFYSRYRPSRLWSAYVRTFGTLGARRAAAVVTVSAFSAGEVMRHFRVPRWKVHVVPNATRLDAVQPEEPAGLPRTRYVLFVGSADRRKGLGVAVDALELAREKIPELHLVVTGRAASSRAPAQTWLHELGGVSDTELVWLYRNAAAVIVPSRYEGFSLPLHEALSFGTPVVASDIPAHRRISGDHVMLVDVDDVHGFARSLITTIERGCPERVADTPVAGWDESATLLAKLYRGLVEDRL